MSKKTVKQKKHATKKAKTSSGTKVGKAEAKALTRKLRRMGRHDKRIHDKRTVAEELARKHKYSPSNAFRSYPGHKLCNEMIFAPNLTYVYTVLLTDRVQVDTLKRALEEVTVRFISLRLIVKSGFFSLYLEESSIYPKLGGAGTDIGEKEMLESGQLAFRVSYYSHRINLEVNSRFADTRVANQFMGALIARYNQLLGIACANDGMNMLDKPCSAECLDPLYNYRPVKPKIPYRPARIVADEEMGINNVTTFTVSRDRLTSHGDTLELLTNILARAVSDYCSHIMLRPQPFTVGVLMDAHERLRTRSLRSATYPINYLYIDEPIEIRESDTDGALSYYYRKTRATRHLPLAIKRLLPHARANAYLHFGGELKVSAPNIVRYESWVGGESDISLSYAFYSDTAVISIATKLSSTTVEKHVGEELNALNINFVVGTNRRNHVI